MAYQIVKGWPSYGAIDEVITADSGVTLTPGTIALYNASGKGIVANYEDTDSGNIGLTAGFVIDYDAVVEGNYTILLSKAVIEVDADHYEAATYAVGDKVTAKGGKFDKVGDADSRTVHGRVLKAPGSDGVMKVLWYGGE